MSFLWIVSVTRTACHPEGIRISFTTLVVVVRRLPFAVLHCPSDGNAGGPRSSYAGVHHDTEAPIDIDNNGVFVLNTRIRDIDVVDGLSYTMFIGEKLIDHRDLGWMSGTRATLRNMGTPINATRPALNNPAWGAMTLSEADALPLSGRSPVIGGFSSNHPGGMNTVRSRFV